MQKCEIAEKCRKTLLHNRKLRRVNLVAEKGKKFIFAVETEDKPALQRIPLNFGLNVYTQTGSDRMVLWSPFHRALGPTSFLERT